MATTINGSAGVITNSGAVYDGLQRGTAVASTSGTSIDFTGIPTWVKRITVMFDGVSTSGTSLPLIQLGDSGGIENTGYSGFGGLYAGGGTGSLAMPASGFSIYDNTPAATNNPTGHFIITNINGNTWICSYTFGDINRAVIKSGAGSKTLSATLDRIRITTVNGTDTFDAGSINILYE